MTPLLAAQHITAFHVVGGILAIWAVVLTALGVTREGFPGKGAGQSIVMAISAVLVVGAIATAIGTAKNAPKGGEQAGKVNKVGPEGTRQAPQGGVVAPGTGANAGQQPGGNAGQKPGAAAPAGGTTKTLLISADPTGQLRFDKDTLAAPAGTVRITMNNPSPVPHNVSIEGPGGVKQQGKTVSKGGASEVQLPLKAGTYTYFCSVDGHRQAGMQGTLTVK
ncbi:MAG TPA: plastocyanin/azurin family copper-binding protein [Thermoleophilaceae bacterium]